MAELSPNSRCLMQSLPRDCQRFDVAAAESRRGMRGLRVVGYDLCSPGVLLRLLDAPGDKNVGENSLSSWDFCCEMHCASDL